MVLRTLMGVLVAGALAGAAQAGTAKKTDCGHQASVVAAVQQARLDRVREAKAAEHVAAQASWPERYNGSIPHFIGWIYGDMVKMRDLRKNDYAAAWNEMCLAQ